MLAAWAVDFEIYKPVQEADSRSDDHIYFLGLVGLYKPEDGVITIDNNDITFFRRVCAFVVSYIWYVILWMAAFKKCKC